MLLCSRIRVISLLELPSSVHLGKTINCRFFRVRTDYPKIGDRNLKDRSNHLGGRKKSRNLGSSYGRHLNFDTEIRYPLLTISMTIMHYYYLLLI